MNFIFINIFYFHYSLFCNAVDINNGLFIFWLASFSLPIIQCKQNFTSMDIQLRTDIKELIDKHSKKYGWVFHHLGPGQTNTTFHRVAPNICKPLLSLAQCCSGRGGQDNAMRMLGMRDFNDTPNIFDRYQTR